MVRSLELGHGVAVPLEGTVDDIGAVVVHVRDHRLVHRAVPLHVARLSVTVSVHILVRKVEHGVLASSPFAVCIGHWRVLWKDASHRPVEQIGVVGQGFGVQGMVVQADGAVVTKTLTESPHNEVGDPNVGKTAAGVEILDWQLTNEGETEEAADLGTGGVVGPVEIRLVDGSGDFLHLAAGEPTSEDSELAFSLWRPGRHDFLEIMLRHTEANQVVVLDILGLLGVNLSALHIIIGVLLLLACLPGAAVLATRGVKRNFAVNFTHLTKLL